MPLQIDPKYCVTIPGILRLSQIGLGILTLICIGAADFPIKEGGFINFVAASALINSLIVLILYVIHFPDVFAVVPWILLELVYSSIWTLFYFIAGCVCISVASRFKEIMNLSSCYGAAAFFCLAAMLAYGIDAYLYFRQWRSGTSTRTVAEAHTTTTTVTTTAKY